MEVHHALYSLIICKGFSCICVKRLDVTIMVAVSLLSTMSVIIRHTSASHRARVKEWWTPDPSVPGSKPDGNETDRGSIFSSSASKFECGTLAGARARFFPLSATLSRGEPDLKPHNLEINAPYKYYETVNFCPHSEGYSYPQTRVSNLSIEGTIGNQGKNISKENEVNVLRSIIQRSHILAQRQKEWKWTIMNLNDEQYLYYTL